MMVIFLNVDGVLNSTKTFHKIYNRQIKESEYGLDIEENKIKLLGKVCQKTGAKVVLSSRWKRYWEKDITNIYAREKADKLKALFTKYNIDVVGITKTIPNDEYYSWKEFEIKDYLLSHPEITSYCILDCQDEDLESLKDFLVKTNFIDKKTNPGGLTKKHTKKIKKLLKHEQI